MIVVELWPANSSRIRTIELDAVPRSGDVVDLGDSDDSQWFDVDYVIWAQGQAPKVILK